MEPESAQRRENLETSALKDLKYVFENRKRFPSGRELTSISNPLPYFMLTYSAMTASLLLPSFEDFASKVFISVGAGGTSSIGFVSALRSVVAYMKTAELLQYYLERKPGLRDLDIAQVARILQPLIQNANGDCARAGIRAAILNTLEKHGEDVIHKAFPQERTIEPFKGSP